MPTVRRSFQSLLGIALLAILLFVILVLYQNEILVPQTSQEQSPAINEVAQATAPDSPLPTAIIIDPIEPTWTPLPTLTPRPTPTLRPDPTLTPFPTHIPAPNASGVIYYTVQLESQRSLQYFSVNENGEKIEEPKSLPIDFGPTLGSTSPDGHYLVLLKPTFPAGVPYILDRYTQQIWPLFKNHPLQEQITGIDFGWHPDSRQLLFWFFENEELWLVNVETGQYTSLAFTYGPPQGAAISPDGQTVVYGNISDGSQEAIWLISSAGGEKRRLLDLQNNLYVFGWAPDGKYILYMGGSSKDGKTVTQPNENSFSELKIVDLTGENPRALSGPFLSGWGFEPEWAPDSQWVVYTGLEPGSNFGCAQQDPSPDWNKCQFEGTSVYIENVSTGEIRNLSLGVKPIWAPDGSSVAFLSNQSGVPEIWTIRIQDNSLRQLTQDAQLKSTFLWSKEGK